MSKTDPISNNVVVILATLLLYSIGTTKYLIKSLICLKSALFSKETLSNRFTEIDILHLNQEERLYKIYGTKTNKLAIEGVKNSTFFGELKEMEHCSDGKLRVVFGVE